MNLLTDALPTAVHINGVEVPITTDFRVCLRVMLAFEDAELTGFEKQAILLRLMFPGQVITDPVAYCRIAVKFLNGGEDGKESEEGAGPRVYSWSKDDGLIFAAFQQTHGIDLETAEIHWWKFLALFMDLGSETTFCQLTSLRKRVKTGKATKEEKRAAREMGEVFDVPQVDTRSIEEREKADEFMRLVEEAERNRAKG